MKSFIIIIATLLLGINPGFATVDPEEKPAKFRIVAVSAENDSIMSTSNIITLFKPFSVDIPTAFTPNGDGLNDTFGAKAQGVKEYKMVIYNRFGEVVFTSTDIEQRWDGTFKGDQAPSGGYVYQVYAKGNEGHGTDRSGKIMLIN
jgi:gliding motility-associated-like protein